MMKKDSGIDKDLGAITENPPIRYIEFWEVVERLEGEIEKLNRSLNLVVENYLKLKESVENIDPSVVDDNIFIGTLAEGDVEYLKENFKIPKNMFVGNKDK